MIDSLKKNKYGIIIMFFSSICVCFGQYFWKISTNNILYLFIGFVLYGLGAILMLIAYKFGSLSVLQPILSMNYVFALIIGALLLKEEINAFSIIGVVIIFIGVMFIATGDSTKENEVENIW